MFRIGILLAATLLWAAAAQAQPPQAPARTITNPPPPTDDVFRKELQIPFRDLLKKRQLSTQDKQLGEKVVHYTVYQLIVPGKENQRARTISQFQQNNLRPSSTTDVARQFLLEQAVAYGGLLLDEPAIDSKVIGAHWLSQLNLAYNPDLPFVPAYKELNRALDLPNSAIAAKVVAAKGLGRILKTGDPSLPVRFEIIERLVKEVRSLRTARGTPQAADPVGYQFLLYNLAQALGQSNRVYNSTRQPIVVDALMEVLTDDKEDWLARAYAAQALSRLPYESNANLQVLNYETARLVHGMATTYNANINAAQPWPLWRRVAIAAYIAYEAENANERTANLGLVYQVKRPGLAQYDAKIREARGLVMPIVNTLSKTPVLKPVGLPQISQAPIDALGKWLADNRPASRKVTPESREPPAAVAAGGGA